MEKLTRNDQSDYSRLSFYVASISFLLGLALVGIGSLSVSHSQLSSLVAGEVTFWSVIVTGLVLIAVLATLVIALSWRSPPRKVAVGSGLALLGIYLFWMLIPASWNGTVTITVVPGVVVYGAGMSVLLSAFFTAATEAGTESPTVMVDNSHEVTEHRNTTVSDGGTENDGLTFFRDEEE